MRRGWAVLLLGLMPSLAWGQNENTSRIMGYGVLEGAGQNTSRVMGYGILETTDMQLSRVMGYGILEAPPNRKRGSGVIFP